MRYKAAKTASALPQADRGAGLRFLNGKSSLNMSSLPSFLLSRDCGVSKRPVKLGASHPDGFAMPVHLFNLYFQSSAIVHNAR
jgi:hypothetical protein